ncbi:MAG: PQQ-dependent sugar dehydrogenase [Verrucomicrobiales bacterium]|nr:PQQ-dependent sugar dehydrogenase [Verrucomicrobiales bacterium]
MTSLFFSLFSKLSLFVASAGIGMAAYFFFAGTDSKASYDGGSGAIRIPAVESRLHLPMEASLLARTQAPVDVSGDSNGVLYILQHDGKVIRIDNEGTTMKVSTQYADLSDKQTDREIGFSAIAFHPEFLMRERPGFGKFYVIAAEKARSAMPDFIPQFGFGPETHQEVLYEYRTDFPYASNFKGQRREVMRFSQPGREHNVTSITFDLYGHLFLAVGDGADMKVDNRSASKNASSLANAYGKILRINPMGRNSVNGKYGIPKTNPFQLVSNALPELWTFGLRAPHSLSFDPFLQNLCIGESGENGIEKVNISEYGGEHFGWDLLHGSGLFNLVSSSQLAEVVTSPSFAIDRKSQAMGTHKGNVIYRGENFPSLAGRLIVANESGDLVVSEPELKGQLQLLDLGSVSDRGISGLRTTPTGELLVLCADGSIFELKKTESTTEGSWKRKPLYCLQLIDPVNARS